MDIYRNKKRGVSAFVTFLLIVATALLSGGGVYYWQVIKQDGGITLNNETKGSAAMSKREMIQSFADEVLHTLKDKDMGRLAAFVHPDKGVRFTPYSNVNIQKDVVIPAAEVKDLANDSKKRLWGTLDGSGNPINMTFLEYYKKFIYDENFLEAPQIIFNQAIQRGNSILNVKEAYTNASFIEYHFPGFDKQYNGMDWRSLILVFEQMDGKWYLAGIIHEQWTI